MKKVTPLLYSPEMVKALLAGRKLITRRIMNPQPNDCGSVHQQANENCSWRNEPMKLIHNWELPNEWYCEFCGNGVPFIGGKPLYKCPYGSKGDLLYVREEHYCYGYWKQEGKTKTGKDKWAFQSMEWDGFSFDPPTDNLMPITISRDKNLPKMMKWYKRLARFMPKKHARIWLEITDVRVERIQDISESDCILEGIELIEQNGQTFYKDYRPGYSNVVCKYPKDSIKSLWDVINGESSWNENVWVWVISFKVLSTNGIL